MKILLNFGHSIFSLTRFIVMITVFSLTKTTFCQLEKLSFDNFTVEDGLPHSFIHCVFQDSKCWLWIGTGLGIERFDGYKFKNYGLHADDTNYVSGLIVRSFYESKNGNLYACFEEYGIGYYNRDKDIFQPFILNEKVILPYASVKFLVEDNEGNLWAASKSGVHKINILTGEITTFINEPGNKNSLSDNYVRKLSIDTLGRIWIGTQKGLDLLYPAKGTFIHFSEIHPVLNDEIWEIYIDKDYKIWIGTFHNGIAIVNPDDFSVTQFNLDKTNQRSKTVRSIIQDKNNNYWMGTRGGLYFYNKKERKIISYKNNVFENNSLAHSSILDIIEDLKGDLWIGTRGGLSYLIKEKQGFRHYRAIPGNQNYLNNGEIYCFWIDKENRIWIGTEIGGVNILDRKKGTFEYISQSEREGKGISSNCIKTITDDGHGNILIGTFQGGMNEYNPSNKKIKWYLPDPKSKNAISGSIVWEITKDKLGNIWVGTDNGLDIFNPVSNTFSHIQNLHDLKDLKEVRWIVVDSQNDLWLGSSKVIIYRPGYGIINSFIEKARDCFEDSKGRFWITTEDKGIVLYDKLKGPVKYYNKGSGLISNLTLCILEDNHHMLWISTANGLSQFDPENESFKNYDKLDGLQGNQFVYNAGYKSPEGELIFGGTNGFNIFLPENIIDNKYIPPVYITDFRIFNQPLEISSSKKSILKKSILETSYLEIPYKYNVLTFEFAALNYANSKKNKYKYMLKGFDNDWNSPIEQRSATYTNLNPGDYMFKVIAANDDDYWNYKGAQLQIKILPPFYKTWLFKVMIFFIVFLIIFLVSVFFVKRKNLQNALLFEKEKAKKMHELDMFKFRFFTNISHEIKTPLTLIISPLEKMLKYKMPADEIKKHLEIMQRNAKQLLNLITQLLDYRKLEAGKLKLELKKGDIVKFTEGIFGSFKNMMSEKNISYKFKSVQDEIDTLFDSDKLEKILNNLISNAVKFTYEGGTISLFLSMVIDEAGDYGKMGEKYIKIVINDSGIGINKANLDNIFTRFYRSSNNKDNTGTGIGLTFTKELVELHKGKIFVKSKQGQGSTFTVLLPYLDESERIVSEKVIETVRIDENNFCEEDDLSKKNKKILLIVEDNIDVRSFIKSHFEKDYFIIEATNGKMGVDAAVRMIPDAIISDIMMPEMNGNELCQKLKKDERTSHIPIILLSALSSKENVMEGLIKGADDYITKPFDITLLQTKIENQLSIRKSLRDKYSNEFVLKPSNITISSPDERFLQKAIKIIEKNIDDPNLDIDKFVSQIGISRMQLYRKMAALTNMTVKEFINDIRLKRAAELILQNKLTISEIAYSVGFNDISYFGKCFRKKYGMSATEYIKVN